MTAPEPVERRLSRFLQKVLAQRDYDLIVCSERKATATLRLLIQEMQEPRLEWPWPKVLSSAAIEAYDWESFRGRSILVFEELVHHGKGLRKCREMLEHYAPVGVKIYSAAFAVWEGCVHRPDIWHYAALSDDDFRAYRDELVTALQQHGSLLLDTEHIELTAKVECGLKDFFGELARSANDGQTYSFVSASKRMSVTIMQPGMVDANALAGVLTPGSNTTGVVNKCRILERTHNYFSILPILYPNTRCVVEASWLDALPGFVNRKALERAKPIEIFYLVGLLASIEGLRAVIAALGDLIRRNKVVLEVAAGNFAHLVTMFPNVDIDGLWQHVNEIVLESKHVKPLHSRRAVKVRNITEQVLSEFAFDFFDRLIDREADREDWETGRDVNPEGESCAELFDIAGEIASTFKSAFDDVPADRVIAAVAPDRLIDAGFLVTRVETVKAASNEIWAIRTFSPDAEVVRMRFQQQAAVRGNPWRS